MLKYTHGNGLVSPTERPLRVVHILGGPVQSGAGRGALALHEGLLDLGQDSTLVGKPQLLAVPPRGSLFYGITGRALVSAAWRLRRSTLAGQLNDPTVAYLPISVGLAPQRISVVKNADILHIQWAHAHALGPSFWRWLETAPKPVLFTLRDAWTFTGGCHFPGSCRGYETGCLDCPLLRSGSEFLAQRDFNTKRQAYRGPVTFVAISDQIGVRARASQALKGSEIVTIPNAIQLDSFKRIDKYAARAALGLAEKPMYVAAGAINLDDPRKGANILRQMLLRFGPDSGIHWLLFGRGAVGVPSNATNYGYVNANERLNLIYAASDIFLMPSLEESFGKTSAEAMASGTPVLAFRDTPAEEMINDGIDGWLVPHGDSDTMADLLLRLTARGRDFLELAGARASATPAARYSPKAVAQAHLTLYRQLLAA